MMKRTLLILLGTISGALVSYGAARLIGILFGPLYQSEDDMTRNVVVFLLASLVLMAAGGWVGNGLYRKHLTRRCSRPPKVGG